MTRHTEAKQRRADERERLQKVMQENQAAMDAMQNDYASAQKRMQTIQNGFLVAERLEALTGQKAEPSKLRNALDFVAQIGAAYRPTEWAAQTPYDMALEHEADQDTVMDAAKRNAEDAKKGIAAIEDALQTLEANNASVDPDIAENLQREAARLERAQKDAEYYQIHGGADFSSVVENEKKKILAAQGAFGMGDGYTPLDLYAVNPDSYDTTHASPTTHMYALTQRERDTYLYLRSTQGQEAAKQYYDHLTDDTYGIVTVREAQNLQEATAKLANTLPGGATVLSILTSPIQMAGFGYTLASAAQGKEINPYSRWFAGNDFVGGIRATDKANLSNLFGEGTAGAKLASFLYDAGTGAGDSLVFSGLMPIGGKLATMGTSAGAKLAAKTVGGIVGAIPMGMSAAGGAAQETKLRGGNDAQAMLMAGASLIAETITEGVTVGNIREAFSLGADGIKGLLKQLLSDMPEEAIGEGASQILENVSDEQIMGALGKRQEAIDAYMEQDILQAEAEERADRDALNEIVYAGLVGAASIGFSTTGGYVAGKTAGNGQNQANKGPAGEASQVEGQSQTNENSGQIGPNLGEHDVLTREVAALTGALSTQDESSRTATVAGVLMTGNGYGAESAAQRMTSEYGSEKAVEGARDILLTAAENGQENVTEALTVAALGKGESAAVLSGIMQEGATPENVSALVEAAAADTQNPTVQLATEAAIDENRVATRVKELIADGGLAGLRSYESAESQARANLTEARANREQAVKKLQVAQENLSAVTAQFLENLTDPALSGAHQHALQDVKGAAIVRAQMEQSVSAKKAKAKEAARMLASARNDAMTKIREQARADVAAMKEQEAAQKQAEAQTKAEQAAARQTAESALADALEGTEGPYREAMVSAYDGQADANDYARGFSAVYNRAKLGQSYEKAAASGLTLSDQQRRGAYDAGVQEFTAKKGKGGLVAAYSRDALRNMGDKAAQRQARINMRVLDGIGRKYGRTIVVEDTISHMGDDGVSRSGVANAYYNPKDGTVHVALDAQDGAYLFFATHELTHSLEGTAQYDRLYQFVLDKIGADVTSTRAKEIQAQYAQNGTELTDEAALREVVANSVPAILSDQGIVKELISTDRKLGERIRDFFADFWQNLQDELDRLVFDDENMSEYVALATDRDAVRQAWEMLDEALGGGSATTADNNGQGVSYSIKQDEHGKYVDVETDQKLFDGLDARQSLKKARDYILEHFRNQYIGDGPARSHVTRQTADEYANSANRRNATPEQRIAKGRASAELDNLLSTGTFIEHKADDGRHNEAVNGWDYYSTRFMLNGVTFDGKICILNGDGYRRLYDITSIKELSRMRGLSGGNLNAPSKDSSETSIPNPAENVNYKFSIRETDPNGQNENIINTSISTFGKTYNWNETGYITPNGTRLDFSGKKDGARGGSREMDHREVAAVFGNENALSGTEAMVQFMGMGNIRISPEINGINLSVQPTKAQIEALDVFVTKNRGEVTIDYDNENGQTQYSRQYPRGTYSKTILTDIADYFANGKPNEKSETARFHDSHSVIYSLRSNADLKSSLLQNRDNNEHPDASALANDALQSVDSRYNRRAFASEVSDVLNYLADASDPDVDTAMQTLTETCRAALEKANTMNTEHQDYVADARNYLKTTRIKLTDGQKADASSRFGSYGAFRKQVFGYVKTANDGIPLDSAWSELNALNPSLFPASINEADMPEYLAAAVEAIKPRFDNNFADDIDTAAADMAQSLVDGYFGLDAEGNRSGEWQERYALALRNMPDESMENRTLALRDAALSRYGGGMIVPPGGNGSNNRNGPRRGNGERQFASSTAQNSQTMPDWLKNELWTNDEDHYYKTDTNREQAERAYKRIEQNGFEESRDRLLTLDRYSEDDTAEANLLMAIAFHNGDAETALALASHYNKEGTKAGKELQARKLFTRMSPTGAKIFVSGQTETRLQEYLESHKPKRKKMDKAVGEAEAILRELPAPDADDTVATSRWGVDLNARQRALIDHYELNDTARPGLRYNQATTKQRMLEAILGTPDPLAQTGGGLTLVQRLQYMHDGLAVVTNADLDYIGNQLATFVGAGGEGGGRDADLAVARAYEAFGNITPATLREKGRTWRYTSMLLSIPSALRNVIGNAGQNLNNATAHGVAVLFDKAISKITGERTATSLTMAERAAGWNAFAEETKNTFRDYFTDHAITQRAPDRFNAGRRGRIYQSQGLETMRTMENFLMSVGDRNVWRKAYVNSLAEQNRLNDMNGMRRTQEEIIEQAEADANYATFTEDSHLRDALSQLKQIPGIGDALDFLIPFTGVPTNIAKRMYQFSPLGLATTAVQHGYRALSGQNFDQRAFVNGMARGLTGSAMFAVGVVLGQMGMIKLGTGDEDDQKRYGVKTALGEQYAPYILNPLTGEYVSLGAFAPACSALIMGATANKLFEADEDTIGALLNASCAGIDQILDASYMSSLQEIFRGYGSTTENALNSLLNSAVSQNVPSVIGQLATAIDPYVRDTKDKNAIVQALNAGLISKLPWLRETLPEKVDVAGRSVMSKDGLRNFFDPFSTTIANDDPALNELMRLSDVTGESSFLPSDALSGTKNKVMDVELSGAEKEAYKKRYGSLVFDGGETVDGNGNAVRLSGLRELMNTSAYKAMTDQEKATAIGGVVSAAKVGAQTEATEGRRPSKDKPETDYQKKPARAYPVKIEKDGVIGKTLEPYYKRTGDGAFIPEGISGNFTVKGKQYNLDGEDLDRLWAAYQGELEKALYHVDWAGTDAEVAQAVNKAYTSAQTAAKKWYVKYAGEGK